jgi:hypothetical protein
MRFPAETKAEMSAACDRAARREEEWHRPSTDNDDDRKRVHGNLLHDVETERAFAGSGKRKFSRQT